MARPRPRVLALLTLSLTAVIPLAHEACSGMSEQPIIGQFFTASRLRDNTALANVAIVAFDPRAHGVVSRFSIERVSPERHAPSGASHRPPIETRLVDRSVNGGGRQVDVAKYDGEIATKEVTVSARVRLASGEAAQKTLVLSLQRAILNGDRLPAGRWIITAVRDASSSPTTPR